MYTVLYVDDEQDLLDLARLFLERSPDFCVKTATSARAALDSPDFTTCDAIVSDYQMPEMDGIAFLKAVREQSKTLPFILFTGRGREEVVIEAINNGVDFYLQKGGDVKAQFAELSHKIRMAIERKRAVDEGRESEKRFSSIFHASPIHQLIYEFSTGRILDINDRFLKDMKLSRSQVIGKTLKEIGFHVDDPRYPVILEQLERAGIVRNAELLVRAGNGRTYTTFVSMTRVQVHDQDLVYTQSMNITSQKRSQQTINALLNAPPDVSMLLDRAGTILAVNHAAAVRYAIPVQDLIGTNAYELISSDLADFRREMIDRAVTAREPLVYTDDRSGRAYENHIYPVIGSDHDVATIAVYSRDVTDENRAKQALKESEQKYRLVVEQSHDSIYLFRDNRLLFVNRQAEELTGFTHDELMIRDIWDFIHPDDRKQLKDAAARRFAGGHVSTSFQARILRKDGEVRDSEFFVDLIDFQGKPAILGIVRDITEKKRVEDALLEREEQLHSISDNLPNGMVYRVIIEPDGKRHFIYVSAGVEPLHEVTVEEVLSDPGVLYNQISREDRPLLDEAENRALAAMSPLNFEVRVHTPSGKERWILLRSAPRALPGGGTLWDGIELDITAAKRAEDELKAAYEQLAASQEELRGQFDALKASQELLQESEENYRHIIENMQDVFYQTDREGIITMISAYGVRLVGFDSADEIIGKYRATDFYADPVERDAFLAHLGRDRVVSGYPLTLKERNGELHNAIASSRLLYDADGKVNGVEGILHDITHLKRVKNALRQANRQLNLMTSITRHDIRNQLMALGGWLELSRASVSDPDRMLDLITREQHIASIIEEQINFTTFFDEMGVKEPAWLDPVPLIRKSYEALPCKNIRLDIEISGIEIFADPLFEKVFYNLIDNALRYGGAYLTTIRVTGHRDGSGFVLVIEDDGIGISEKEKVRMFDHGYGKNTGLGLFLIKEILSITGMNIRETGIAGKGARFEIVIPSGKCRAVGTGSQKS